MNISDLINKGLENKDGTYVNPDLNTEDPNYIEASRLAVESRGIDVKDVEKYHKYGLNWSPNRDMDMELAMAQSNWKKAGSSISRLLISELIGGTAIASSDLASFTTVEGPVKLLDSVANALFDTHDPVSKAVGIDRDYSNPFSRKLEELQEKFENEVAPIYRRTDKNIDTGALTGDFGWYAENIPSVASSLTLLIPTKLAMAAPKGIKWAKSLSKANKLVSNAEKAKALTELGNISRAERTAKELNAFESLIYSPKQLERLKNGARTGMEAILMRTMENYQEARQVHQDTYDNALKHLTSLTNEEYDQWCRNNEDMLQGVNTSSKVDVAKHIAREAADKTFKYNYANVIFDAIQLKALGNIGKYARKNVKSAETAISHETSKLNFGRASDDVVQLSTGKKIATNVWAGLKGSANLIASELSEGIEEGVNYISQQEGLTYGKTLLNQENENTLKPWNTRLNDYLSNPEMHESMFWGVVGGVVFGTSGKAYNAHAAYKQNKKDIEERNKKQINTVNEQGNDFISLFDLTETKAAKETFHRREERYSTFKQRLDEIKDDIDPFSLPDENGKKATFEGDDIKKDEAIDKAINAFVTDMTIDHMNSGTLNYLVDLVNSPQFKKAIDQLNLSSDENITNRFLSTIDKVENIYNHELTTINAQVAALNKDIKGEKIPFEYVAQLAAINLDKQLQIDNIDNRIKKLNKQIQNETQDDNSFNAAIIKFDRLRSFYNELEKDKEAIKNDNTLNDIAKSEHIKRLNYLQKTAIDELDKMQNQDVIDTDGSTSFKISTLGFIADIVGYGNEVKTVENNNNKFSEYDNNIVKSYEDKFKKLSNDELINQNQYINKSIAKLLGKDGLYQNNPTVFNNLSDIANLEVLKLVNQNDLIRNRKQIVDKVDDLHNKYNQARYDIYKQVENVVLDIQNKYLNKDGELVNTIIETYFDNKQKALDIAEKAFTEVDANGVSDARRLIDALNVVTFTQNSNAKIFDYLMDTIRQNKEKGKRETNKEEKKSSTNQNAISATENLNVNNPSQPIENSNTERASEQIEGQTQNQQSVTNQSENKEEVQNTEYKIKYNPNTKSFDISDDGHSVILTSSTFDLGFGETNAYKLVLNGNKDDNEILLNDDSLYKQEGANFDDNIAKEVIKEPIVDIVNGNITILEQGEYKLVDVNTGLQPGETQEEKIVDETIKANQVNDENSNNVSNKSHDSSTGSSEELNMPEIKQIKHIDTSTEIKYRELLGTIFDINDNVEDWDKLANDYKKLLLDASESENIDETEIDKYIETEFNNIKQLYDIIHDDSIDEDKKFEAMMSLMARLEEHDTINFSDDFKNAIDKFVDSYAKQLIVPVVDGKKVVLFRDVLRACNDLYPTSDTSNILEIYDSLANYFMSKEANDKYLVLDLDDIKNNKVIDKIQKTGEELNESIYYDYHRVGINEYSKIALNNKDEAYFKALDELMPGDKVTVEKVKNSLLVSKGNVTIGVMAIPRIEGNSYSIYTDGVKTSIYKNSNGEYRSELKEIMEYLFTEDNNDCRKAVELMIKYSVLKNNKDKNSAKLIDDLINDFFKIDVIAINEYDSRLSYKNKQYNGLFFVDNGTVNRKQVFDYFYKIWNYTNNINATGYNNKIDEMRYNLNDYFEKLYQVYDAAYNWGDKTEEVPVMYINDGSLNLIFDESTRASEESLDYTQFKNPSEAIANKAKAKLGIYDNKKKTLYISTRGKIGKDLNVNTNKDKYIQQVLILEGKNVDTDPNAYHVVKSFNKKLTDNDNKFVNDLINSVFNLIKADIQNIVTTRHDEHKEKHELAVNKFIEDIKSIVAVNGELSNGEGIIPLFRFKNGCNLHKQTPISDKFITNGIEFNVHKGNFTQNLFISYDSNNKNGLYIKRTTKNAPIEEKEFRQIPDVNQTYDDEKYAQAVAITLTDYIRNNCVINSDLKGVELDNNNISINRGFIKNKNGKLSVSINTGDVKTSIDEEFDSYSSYILDNDLIKVNTYIGENGLNFSSRTENQLANQTLYINLNSLPVKETIDEKKIEELTEVKVDKDLNKELKEIIKQQHLATNVSLKLLSKIKDDSFLQRIKEVADEVGIAVFDHSVDENIKGIFPSSIKYDSDLNRKIDDEWKGVIAAASPIDFNPRYKSNFVKYNKAITNEKGKNIQGSLKRGDVVVGDRWLEMASSSDINRRNRAVRKLIHEKLHLQIHNNVEYGSQFYEDVQEVYEIFNKELQKKIKETNNVELKKLSKLFLNYNHNVRLEEFIVEAITNKVLFDFLNSIQVEDVKNNKTESLFSKIINFITKLFGWEIKDNSLYQKFYNVLSEELTDERRLNANDISKNVKSETSNVKQPTKVVIKVKPKNQTVEEVKEEPKVEPKIEPKIEENYDIENDTNTESNDDIDFDTELDSLYEETDLKYEKDRNTINAIEHSISIENKNNFEKLGIEGLIEYKCN